MDWKYTLSEPVIGEAEIAAAVDCLDSAWLSMGPRTQELERRFAEAHGVGHAIAVANGTAALHLAMTALEIGAGDEVVQPAINFVAAANMTTLVGGVPVFADIVSLVEPTIDPAEIRRRIGPRTKAVVVMHFGGYPARIEEIAEICREAGVALIEDACHAPLQQAGASGRFLGTFADVGCFSFFSNKNMTTGEGGMVVTNDDELAARIRLLRSHGMTSLSWDRHHGRPSSYDVCAHGFNYRIDDLRAAIGLAQFARLPDMNARRRDLAALYAKEVAATCGGRVAYVFGDQPRSGTAHLGAVIVDPAARDAVRQELASAGIQTSLHYPPITGFTAFSAYGAESVPLSNEFASAMITLPLYVTLPDQAVGEIVGRINESLLSHAA